MISRILTALALGALAISASADGDPAAGQTKSTTCAACHGPDGNSTNPEWPKIAGQHAGYIEQQLVAFKEGKARSNPMMAGMVAPLSEQDMKDLAAYFSGQSMSGGYASEALVKLGEKIYRAGNPGSGVPACMSCHGVAGDGDPQAGFPRLAGQHAAYTRAQLESYRAGTRAGSAKEMMPDIATRMTPAEMEAVASYINGLH